MVRQASKAASFAEASDDVREWAGVSISTSHLQRLSERMGQEWAEVRDQQAETYQQGKLACDYVEAPRAAAVMLDGGRVQTRAADCGAGVDSPSWQETKVACCLSLASTEQANDPQPEPPKKFLDPPQVLRLAQEVKSRGRPALGRSAPQAKCNRRRKRKHRQVRKLVRTVVATMANSDAFGWQMAAEVQRRGLDRAKRKACVCDGQRYNWTLFEMHLLPSGFIGILDFVHLVAYLHDAAHACNPGKQSVAWKQYTQWLRWAWSGQVKSLLASLRKAARAVGEPSADAADDDPRSIVATTLHYVENNRTRMNYPEYRRLGLPISSALVESTIKQINRRMKGSEKFWLNGGAEAMLQLRAAYLSDDGRANRYWSRPRPYTRAAGAGRLRPAV
jgi:hypothetical protein